MIRTITELAAQAIDDYRTLCAREGVDPEAELTEVRLASECTIEQWIAVRIAAASAGRERPEPAAPGAAVAYPGASATAWACEAQLCAGPAEIRPLVYRPGAPAEFLAAASLHPELTAVAVGQLLAGHPDGVLPLVGHPDVEVRKGLWRNGWRHPGIVEALAGDPDTTIRSWVAGHRELPEECVRRLAADPDPHVRMIVLARTALPADVVHGFADDEDRFVRAAYARHRRARADLLARLADDPDLWVRRSVAMAARTPDDVRERLKADANHLVALPAMDPARHRRRDRRR